MPLAPSLKYALHPYLPERLGFRSALRLLNPEAANLLDQTDKNTLLISRSRITLLREGKDVLRREVPGDFVEFGVHKGGSAAVLASVIKDEPERQLHLFDRWGDLPEPTDEDGFRKEQYTKSKIPEKLAALKGSLDDTKHIVEDVIGFPKERTHYYQGWYDDTLKLYPGRSIAFASIDCDYYESVKAVLAVCDQYASPGAALFVEDYGHWPGAKRAVHEWLESTKRKVQLVRMRRIGNAIIRLGAAHE
jgi:O-methyltransferase